MATETTQTQVLIPEYIEKPTEKMANTLDQLMQQQFNVPQQQVAGFSPTQQAAMMQAYGGIGAYQPFLQAATDAQAAALGTTGAGVQALGQMNFDPARAQAFMDPYQQSVTQEALKEIDRQAAMAGNQLAGKAVQAGAFGGSRFGLQQSELARSAQDLRSRRIFEDLSRNYQQAQQAAAAANQQRLQQGAAFGQLGSLTSGIGGQMAGLGGQAQQLGMQDVSSTLGIGGLQQKQLQRQADVQYQNQLNQMMEPYRRLSFGTQSLQQLTPGAGTTQQTISPVPQGNPYLQAAGAIGSIGTGLGALIGN